MSDDLDMANELIDIELANKAIQCANDGITIVDMTLRGYPLIYINKAFEKITGYTNADVIGKNCRFLQGDYRYQPELEIVRNAIKNKIACRSVLTNFKKDGTLFYNELSLAPIFNADGKLKYYVGIQKDVTNDIMQKEKIFYLSEHDDLTGLYNYRGFFKKINAFIAQAKNENLFLGVGMADIDHFKQINDHYGHLKGNNILKIIASELIEEFDAHTIIGRFGGDEFCFAMLFEKEDSYLFYNKIAKVLHATNFALSNCLQIRMSAGIAFAKEKELIRIDHLIHRADNIMYGNKQIAHLSRRREDK